MKRVSTVVCAAVVSLVLVAPGISGAATKKSPITISVAVAKTSVVAGTPIHGVAILTNTSSKSVTVKSCAANGWLFVGVANAQIPFGAASTAVACAPSVHLKPGANRFAVTIITTYSECSQVKNPNVPRCTKSGAPPLPKGVYKTSVIVVGLPPGTPSPRAITVTLH